jgi:hypothetical protein
MGSVGVAWCVAAVTSGGVGTAAVTADAAVATTGSRVGGSSTGTVVCAAGAVGAVCGDADAGTGALDGAVTET